MHAQMQVDDAERNGAMQAKRKAVGAELLTVLDGLSKLEQDIRLMQSEWVQLRAATRRTLQEALDLQDQELQRDDATSFVQSARVVASGYIN